MIRFLHEVHELSNCHALRKIRSEFRVSDSGVAVDACLPECDVTWGE
jgi:hypothetical protein